MAIVTSLILYVANHVMLSLVDWFQPGSIPLISKRTHKLNTYEVQIAQNIIKPELIAERLDDIGGLKDIKTEIRSQVLLPLKYPKIFFADVRALHPPRGLLFYGPPGTGKTMLARCIAAEAGVPFISLTLSTLENKYFGESSKLLHANIQLSAQTPALCAVL